MSMIGHLQQLPPVKLEAAKRDTSIVGSLIYDSEKNIGIAPFDLDKTWGGIHYLLTGQIWGGDKPLADAICGGVDIGDDLGYGPARYLTPLEVQEVADALSQKTKDDLRRKFDPVAMERSNIYPLIWTRDCEEALEWLLTYFDGFVKYYQDASANGNAMLIYID